MPICRTCGIDKDINCFSFRLDTKKYRLSCKDCIKEQTKEYRFYNRDFLSAGKLYWQKTHPDNRREICKRYYLSHRDETRVYQRNYKRYGRSLEARLISCYRGRIWKAIRRGDRSKHTAELLGCSVDILKNHLEKSFKNGMNWENYGLWHVDHIKPCAKFDLSNEIHQLECFNYKNLQPLWAKENRLKSAKYGI